MDIKQLQPKQSNVDITLDVINVGDTRQFQKFGKEGKVATAEAKDEKGDKIKLTLWNEDIDKIKSGDKIQLTNGYVSEWQGELQLTTGRFGKLEVIGKAEMQKESDENVVVYRNYPSEQDKETIKDFEEGHDADEESVDEI